MAGTSGHEIHVKSSFKVSYLVVGPASSCAVQAPEVKTMARATGWSKDMIPKPLNHEP